MEAAANGILITDPQGKIQWTNPALTQISGYEANELISQSTRIFNSGRQDTDFYSQMWNTIRSGNVWHGEMTNRRSNGDLYVEEQTITPVQDENGRILHFIAIKQDVTLRKQAEEELERRNVDLQILSNAEHKQRQFSEALVKAALILNKSLNLDEVLALILEQIDEVIPYCLANITLLDGETFYVASQHGDSGTPETQAGLKNRTLVEKFPLLVKMRQSGRPVLILDTQQEPDWIILNGLEWCYSFLSAPLLVENQVIGFVNLYAEETGHFTQEMCDRLVAFAAHATVAIQNAWLFEQVRASSERLHSLSRRLVDIQESERHYIARELHDEAGQMLTSLVVDLGVLEKRADQPDQVLKKVAEMDRSLNDVIENLHRIAVALRPASLDHVGLVAALRQHVESVGEKNSLKVSFKSDETLERLPDNVETVLYRIVQEALTNIVRHAHASWVDVVLMVRKDKLIVIVEDDGIGFDPDAVLTDDHLGLFGMRERAEMIEGKLVVESRPGNGTTVMVEVGYGDKNTDRR
jgi:PAS domain S-box-containing protein